MSEEQAQQLFRALRKLDDLNYKLVYAACPQSEGLSLAVYNRMIRAAGFEVQTLD
ncbi:MAG: Sua5 family C-terminal domain-containing protein [Acutalibacteraceae bacterium]